MLIFVGALIIFMFYFQIIEENIIMKTYFKGAS